MQAVIVAGGKGTRLRERLGDLPKPMADVCGRPILEHQITLLRECGFTEVLILAGYNAHSIRNYFGDGSSYGIRITYVVESTALGSAGAVLGAFEFLAERFCVLYGDTMLNVDLGKLWQAHAKAGAAATLFVHPNDHPQDSDLVELDGDSFVEAFHPYPHAWDRYYPNLVNAALYIVERNSLVPWRAMAPPLDFGKNLLPAMLNAGQRILGYRSREYIKDAGTPERLDRVIQDCRANRVAHGSLATPAPAVFVDRDGTINEEVDRVSKPEQLKIMQGAADAIRKLNQSEYKLVVITNQPVIARGDCTESELRMIHNKLETDLGKSGAYVDAIYYCPHHPHRGFAGERPELKIVCSCRKPEIGLIRRACEEMNLDLHRSCMIGDSAVDVMTAKRAGIPALLVGSGRKDPMADASCEPDYRFPSLTEAADFVLSGGLA